MSWTKSPGAQDNYPSGTTSKHSYTSDGPVLPCSKSSGISVNPASPAFTYRESYGLVVPKTTGSGSPTSRVYRGGYAYAWAFINGDGVDVDFNFDRDILSESPLDLHVHWSHNGTNISGLLTMAFNYTYARSYNQDNYGAEKQVEISYNTTDISTTPQYRERVDSCALSTPGGSATLIDEAIVEPCLSIFGRLRITTLPTITGGHLFIHACNILYKSTSIGTVAKIPPFYTPLDV